MKKSIIISIIACFTVCIILFSFIKSKMNNNLAADFLNEPVYADSILDKDPTKLLEDAIDGDKPVVVLFYSRWCSSCSLIDPVYDAVKKDYADKAIFVKVDVDIYPQLSSEFRVLYLPTLYEIDPESKSVTMLPVHKMTNEKSFKEVLDTVFKPSVQ